MKDTIATLLICALLLLAARSRAVTRPTQADEARAGMCAELSGVALGFCVALCEARQCDLRPDDDERCAILRRGFERATGGLPPPC
jgi:phage-related baseplate assembly protein